MFSASSTSRALFAGKELRPLSKPKLRVNRVRTVKLGLYVHSVITFSPSITDMDNRKTYTFFLDKTYRTVAQNRILRTNFPSKSTFLPFLWFFFFWSRACHPTFQFQFQFPARFQVQDALKGDFTVRKTNNEPHSRRRSIFRGRSFAWTRGTGPAGEENRVLDRTYFGYYVPFFISLEGT